MMNPVRRRRMPDLLVIAQEDWGPVERRNQLLLKALAARNPHSRLLFVEQALRLRELRRWGRPRPSQVASNIWTVRALRPLPDSVSRARSDAFECAQIQRAVKQVGLERPVLWSQNPRVAHLVDRLRVDGLIYDLTDDWAAFERDPERRKETSAQIASLARRADLVLACSRHLETQARAWTPRVRYLPNAIEDLRPAAPAPELLRLPSPRLGYAGTLHSARLDVSLVARAAELRPNWSFVFLGPNFLDANDWARLGSLPNAYYLGVRSHEQVQPYLAGFDVCLMPNLLTDFTRSLDPLKLYEYLAAGRPVLATPFGIPDELASQITLFNSPEDLVAKAERAVSDDGPIHVAARRAAVSGATWDARAAELEDALGVTPEPPHSVDVSVVVVSFNTSRLLERCLSSLEEQDDVTLQTIVVDNASTDGSPELVRTHFPDIDLVELQRNVGFARANNLALSRCRGTYVLLLNSDAFLHPGALRELIAAAQRHSSAGVIGPRLLNPDGTLQRSAWPFPRPGRIMLEALGVHRALRRLGVVEDLGSWDHDEERAVDFLIGACLLLRAEAFSEVGGFDEEFWLYGEEADLQRRLWARGWSVVLAPRAVVTHVGGASSSVSAVRLRHFYSGQRRFLQKHSGHWAWAVVRCALLIGSIARRRWEAARVVIDLK